MSTIARCVRFSSLASFFSTSRFKSQFAFFGFNNDGYETKNQKTRAVSDDERLEETATRKQRTRNMFASAVPTSTSPVFGANNVSVSTFGVSNVGADAAGIYDEHARVRSTSVLAIAHRDDTHTHARTRARVEPTSHGAPRLCAPCPAPAPHPLERNS
jgi:hypothetical protein